MNGLLFRVLCVEKDAGSSGLILSRLFSSNDKYALTLVHDRHDAFHALRNNRYRLCLIDYRLAEANWSFLKRSIVFAGRATPFIFFSSGADESAHLQAVQMTAAFCRPLSAEIINNLEDIFALLQRSRPPMDGTNSKIELKNAAPSIFFTFM